LAATHSSEKGLISDTPLWLTAHYINESCGVLRGG
jgi:hypothetical protein